MKRDFNAARKSGAATRTDLLAELPDGQLQQSTDVERKLDIEFLLAVKADDKPRMIKALDSGADINAVDGQGAGALHILCRAGREDFIYELVKRGADINIRDGGKNTPLLSAMNAKRFLLAKWLIEQGAELEARNEFAQGAIHIAAKHGEMDILAALQARNADLDPGPATSRRKSPQDGFTPLIFAIQHRKPEFARALIAAGVDVNRASRGGETALQWAAWKGEVDTLNLLLEKGAEVDAAVPGTGETALFQAVVMGHDEAAEILIDKGADIHLQVGEWNLLIAAAANGQPGIAKRLIEKGVDTTARDSKGRDAVQVARAEGHEETADALAEIISRRNTRRIKSLYLKHHVRQKGVSPS